MWGNMPYIKKHELQMILSDLPEYHSVGRSWRPATVPTAAMVYVHVDLDHLKGDIPKEDLGKIRSKYRNLPDLYWQDGVEAIITPERFAGVDLKVVQQPSKSQHAK